MIRLPAMCALAALVLMPGCSRVAQRSVAVEEHQSGASYVGFDLQPLQGADGSRQWIGVHNSSGKVARFRIDLGAPEVTPGKAAGDSAVRSGEGTLVPEPGSDSSVLLADLQKALRAKNAPSASLAKTSIPFTYVDIGENLSQASTGGFSGNPPGNWTALKLIFGEGDHESEIFLHLNASTRKGQFSMKDPRYGDLALAELAKVL
jgi:hypothetical protein